MSSVEVLALLALVCALTALGFGVAIANELRARGLRANPLLIRFMVFRYLAMYKRVTVEETGEIGPLYRPCATAGSLALVLTFAMIVTHLGTKL
jgi:hypothetical protein